MSLALWHDGKQIATSTDWSITGLILSGYVTSEHLTREAIVVDELSGGHQRIVPLKVFLKKQMPSHGERQNMVSDIRKRVRELEHSADALEDLLDLAPKEMTAP